MANGEWDVFGPDWGLGLPIDWFDTTAITALLDDSQLSNIHFERLVAGWDGDPEDAMELARKVLRARAFFFGENEQGKIAFARVSTGIVTDLATPSILTPIPRVLNFAPGEGEGVDRITGNLGETPWFDGQKIEVNMVGEGAIPPNSLRAGIFAERRVIDLDLSCLAPGDSSEAAGLDLIGMLTIRSWGSPYLTFRANDPGDVAVGDVRMVGDPDLQKSWFVDQDGTPIEVDTTSPRWLGQVTSIRRNFGDGSIDITMAMHLWHLNKYPRLRAPAAVIDGTISGTTYTCLAGSFDPDNADVSNFTVGDKVELWKPDFSRRSSDVQEITVIDAANNEITLDADFTTTAVDGDILRYALLNDSTGNPEDDSPKIDGFVAYVFMSDADDTVGPADNEAHIYGFGF